MLKVVIFSGGTGSRALQEGINDIFKDKIDLSIIINAYDNGLSTGDVRKVMNGKILGPSDLRKNQVYQSELKWLKYPSTEGMKTMVEFLNYRFDAVDAKLAKEHVLKYTRDTFPEFQKDKNDNIIKADKRALLRNNFISLIEKFFDNSEANIVSYSNFALSNIIYAALAQINDYSLDIAGEIMATEYLKIPKNRVFLVSDESLFLHAMTESGKRIIDEGVLVEWNNPKDKINEVFLVNDKLERKSPTISDKTIETVRAADVIIFSCGTQWSSLIPTYIHTGFRPLIEKSKAKKYLVMNNQQDEDMLGIDSDNLQDILNDYLPMKEITTVFNSCAYPTMKTMNTNFPSLEGRFNNNYSKTHDSIRLTKFIFKDYYAHNVDKFLFDFDGTIIGRHNDYKNESEYNMLSFRRNETFAIITGNSLSHINKHLGRNNSQNEIYCDGGNSRCTWSDSVGRFVFRNYINEKYVMLNEEIEHIYSVIVETGIPAYKIENRNNVVISIKPLEIKEKMEKFEALQALLYAYQIKINGKTTIDIMKKNYTKLVIFESRRFKGKRILYVGDELEKGNDEVFDNRKDTIVYPVNNPKDTSILMKIFYDEK